MLDCCLGVVRCAKSHPDMSRLTRGQFVWSGGVMATSNSELQINLALIKIVCFYHILLHKLSND